MIGYFDLAISTIIILVIVFAWIVIILRRGYTVASDVVRQLEKYKELASQELADGTFEIDHQKLAQLLHEAIVSGDFRP